MSTLCYVRRVPVRGAAGAAPRRPPLQPPLESGRSLTWDDDVLSTLAHLMEADVLLGSPSAFSALAALCAARTQLQLSFPKAYYAPPHDAAWQGLGLSLPAPPVCTCRTHGANASLSAALSSPHTAAGTLAALFLLWHLLLLLATVVWY